MSSLTPMSMETDPFLSTRVIKPMSFATTLFIFAIAVSIAIVVAIILTLFVGKWSIFSSSTSTLASSSTASSFIDIGCQRLFLDTYGEFYRLPLSNDFRELSTGLYAIPNGTCTFGLSPHGPALIGNNNCWFKLPTGINKVGTSFTIMFWTSYINNASNGGSPLISTSTSTGNTILVEIPTNTNLLSSTTPGGTPWQSSSNLLTNQFFHAALVYNQTDSKGYLYINGTFVSKNLAPWGITSDPLQWGNAFSTLWSGYVQELIWYPDIPLSSSVIQAIYQNESCVVSSSSSSSTGS